MTGYLKKLFFALVLGAICYTTGPGRVFAQTPQQKPKPKQQVQQQAETDQKYTEEEYDAYEKATKETDAAKRIDMLLAFMEKWPKSELMSYIDTSYQTTMYELNTGKNFAKLLPAAEAWLKLHPNDMQAMGYSANAAEGLGNDQKYLEYAEKIYAVKPVPQLAASIHAVYKKIGNQAKYEEWTEKIMNMPEYAGEWKLRYTLVEKYDKEKNATKAAESAQLTLKSLDAAKKPENQSQAEWNTETTSVRRICTMVIAMNAYEKKRWAESIKYLEAVSKINPNMDEAYYYIAQCMWHNDKIEEAIQYFAMAELCKGNMAKQAKEKVETLYKPLHNQTTIGIEKIYKKATDELAARKAAK
jgi:hypothetical protein